MLKFNYIAWFILVQLTGLGAIFIWPAAWSSLISCGLMAWMIWKMIYTGAHMYDV